MGNRQKLIEKSVMLAQSVQELQRIIEYEELSRRVDQILKSVQIPRTMFRAQYPCIEDYPNLKKCPLSQFNLCKWTGFESALKDHCSSIHSERVFLSDNHVFYVWDFKNKYHNLRSSNHYYMMFEAFGEFFYLYHSFNYSRRRIDWKAYYKRTLFTTNKFSFLVSTETGVLLVCHEFVSEEEISCSHTFDDVFQHCIADNLYYRVTIVCESADENGKINKLNTDVINKIF